MALYPSTPDGVRLRKTTTSKLLQVHIQMMLPWRVRLNQLKRREAHLTCEGLKLRDHSFSIRLAVYVSP